MQEKVIAVIVTYNRKKLLLECINAILKQTYEVQRILIIDNASTDGTYEYLRSNNIIFDKIEYIVMKYNTGGAGGFYEGIKRFLELEYDNDWLWIMDDDTVPTETCLQQLVLSIHTIKKYRGKIVEGSTEIKQKDDCIFNRPISFLASAVYGNDGEFMNVPGVCKKHSSNGYMYWYEMLKYGLVNIESATFVSLLISNEAVRTCGLPCKDYFLWGDDVEYTKRLIKYYGDAFLVGSSIAIHKRVGARNITINETTDTKRIELYYYRYRNRAINERLYNEKYRPFLHCIREMLGALRFVGRNNGFLKMRVIIKGSITAIIEYKKYADFIYKQLNLSTNISTIK